jgi:hypothetical protein
MLGGEIPLGQQGTVPTAECNRTFVVPNLRTLTGLGYFPCGRCPETRQC